MVRSRPVARRAAALVIASLPALVAACSSGSSSSTSTTVAPGTAVLGASFAVWVQAHPPNDASGQPGYGGSVARSSGPVPQFTEVRQLDGKVVSMLVNLPSGTDLAAAVGFVRAQLPPDARQTASWRGTFPITAAGPAAYCEFINYESDDLARSLGIPPPAAMAANIGVSFYQETGQRAGSSNIATVNTAAVSTAANVPGSSC